MLNNEKGYHEVLLQKWLFSVNVDINYFKILNKASLKEQLEIHGFLKSGDLEQVKAVLDTLHNATMTMLYENEYPTIIKHEYFGIKSYNEVDPFQFIMIVPILFGILIGDIGHGLIYLIITLFLYTSIADKIFYLKGTLKFLTVLISLFTIYSGFIFNQFFSVPLAIFKSPFDENSGPYLFGLDYHFYDFNRFDFLFHFKLKLIYVLVFTMILFGLCVKFINISMEFKLMRLFNALPQFILFFTWFGYPIFLMILVWLKFDVSVYHSIFNMILKPLTPYDMYPHQFVVENCLKLIALLCLLWLLLVNPITLYFKQRIYNQQGYIPISHIHLSTFSSILHKNMLEISAFVFNIWSGMQSFLRIFAFSIVHCELNTLLWMLHRHYLIWTFLTLVLAIVHGLFALGISVQGFIVFTNQFYKGNGTRFSHIDLYRKSEVRT
eukprot:NODE_438_length_7412_cov_0.582798.p1 type:complete len:437 gc:universal NODE_438_length_7412_cov_0.582798:3262-4572(+)